MRAAAARAHANIALIKYWGKRDARLNLPAAGSISVTLADLATETWVAFADGRDADEIHLASGGDPARVSAFLDIVRASAGINYRARVFSRNNFPTGAGLASSASAFAALALAASRAAGQTLSAAELSVLARRGSGSAARSIHGGWVEMRRGQAADGVDAHAVPLAAPHDWPLCVVVAVTETGAKTTGSTAGMHRSADTSPFYRAWIERTDDDLAAMRAAIAARDFCRVGDLSEHSCLKMHALMFSSRPPLLYWNAATVAAWHAVQALRADGTPAYATIDAGPQVKVLCLPDDAPTVAAALADVVGVQAVRTSNLGPGVHAIQEPWPES